MDFNRFLVMFIVAYITPAGRMFGALLSFYNNLLLPDKGLPGITDSECNAFLSHPLEMLHQDTTFSPITMLRDLCHYCTDEDSSLIKSRILRLALDRFIPMAVIEIDEATEQDPLDEIIDDDLLELKNWLLLNVSPSGEDCPGSLKAFMDKVAIHLS